MYAIIKSSSESIVTVYGVPLVYIETETSLIGPEIGVADPRNLSGHSIRSRPASRPGLHTSKLLPSNHFRLLKRALALSISNRISPF